MRILHFLPSLSAEAGGPARAVPDLCRALAAAGHSVTLTSADLGNVEAEWQGRAPIENLRLILAPSPRLPAFTYSGSQLRFFSELLNQHDALHVHGIWEYANIQISRLASAMRKPYVVSVRGMLGAWPMDNKGMKKRLFLRLAGARWLSAADSIHFTAQTELDDASKWISVRRGMVIPNLLDLEPYRSLPPREEAESMLNLPRGRPRILFLSRIHPVKSLETLLHAVALLKTHGKAVALIVAGDGDAQYVSEMKALAQRLGLENDAMFVGMVTGTLKLSLFQACDLLAVPTKHENFGFVFVEALACGLPVVTTRDVGIRSDLEASGVAAIVERTPQAFADGITDMLSRDRGIANAREAGRQWLFDWLSPQALVAKFASIYGASPRPAEREGNR